MVACLADDPAIELVTASLADGEALDLVITSVTLATRWTFGYGLLICAHDSSVTPVTTVTRSSGCCPARALTASQLRAAVRAAVPGCRSE